MGDGNMYINPCPGCGEPGREHKHGTHSCTNDDCGVKFYDEKEDWDEPVTPTCPCCGANPGRATFSTATHQSVCPNPNCPVNTWNENVRVPAKVAGSSGMV